MDYKKLLQIFEELIKKTKKSFSNKKREKIKSRILLHKLEKNSKLNKRQSIKIRFDFLRLPIFLQKHYIPYFTIISIILFIGGLFVFLGPIFKVTKIEIIKKENITNMEVAYKSIEDFRGESIFKIDKSEVLVKMQNYQQNIKNIDLNIDLPETLKITVESYAQLFNTNINDKIYTLLENGSLIPSKAINEDLYNLVIKSDFDKNKFLSYKKIFDETYISKINEIIKKLKDNIVNIKIINLEYYEIERELHIEIENGTILLFSLDSADEITEQIKKLVIFNKEHLDIIENNLIYIDLRIANKIFFCDYEEEYSCRTNLKSIYN